MIKHINDKRNNITQTTHKKEIIILNKGIYIYIYQIYIYEIYYQIYI